MPATASGLKPLSPDSMTASMSLLVVLADPRVDGSGVERAGWVVDPAAPFRWRAVGAALGADVARRAADDSAVR
jgi:hypothetical protein